MNTPISFVSAANTLNRAARRSSFAPSEKQIRYLAVLFSKCTDVEMANRELSGFDMYGEPLDRSAASALIDQFKPLAA